MSVSFIQPRTAAGGSSADSGDPQQQDWAKPAGFDALRGRVVVLTGASSGIGRATAQALASQGADVVLAARNAEALDEVAKQCNTERGSAIAVPTDVTDADAMRALRDAAIARYGHIDVWINNVGVGAVGLFDSTPIDAHRRVVESNLIGHMNGAHAVLPHFRERCRGILINMISLGGWVASPYAAAYTASKFGIRGFSESLRAELSKLPRVHVCDVYPTFVDTPGISHGANYTGRSIAPPPPVLDPRRVADAIVSLVKRPRASVYVGAPAWPGILAHAVAPDWVARIMMRLMEFSLGRADRAARTDGNLFEPSKGNAVDGGFRASPERKAVAGVAVAAVGAAVAVAWLASRRGRR
ncbi:Short-chain dehydrogenase [Burkholderiales bacterium 8X]|nr:Short-chain dehydrogenase [Burkholderiales bacterium 8X]